MDKAVFLDRDGTINVEKGYLYKIEDFEFLPGVISSLRLLQEASYLIVIITNQSGIARGYYKDEDYMKLNEWMVGELARQGVKIEKSYYCPHHPEAKIKEYRLECNCRKPKLGLYEKVMEELSLNLSLCCAIGDKIRDCSICETTDCKGFLISDNEKADIIEKAKSRKIRNVEYAVDLKEAVEKLLKSPTQTE